MPAKFRPAILIRKDKSRAAPIVGVVLAPPEGVLRLNNNVAIRASAGFPFGKLTAYGEESPYG